MKRLPQPADLPGLQARVGHAFRDPALLVTALTHLSFAPVERARAPSYQRLEFLGDRVLGLIVSAMLVDTFPEAEEGELSRRLAGLVRKETCAEVAAQWEVSGSVRLGEGEALNGDAAKPAILGDVCEAIIGAVFSDGGFEAARAVVVPVWTPRMLAPSRPLRDPKTALQEWAQGQGRAAPVYREVERQGPAHAPEFTVAVDLVGFPAEFGRGTSKRTAEQGAAEAFLRREGIEAVLDRMRG